MDKPLEPLKILVVLALVMGAFSPIGSLTGRPVSAQALSTPAAADAAPNLLTTPTPISNLITRDFVITSGLIYLMDFCNGGEQVWNGHLSRLPARGGPTRSIQAIYADACQTFWHQAADAQGMYSVDYNPATSDGDGFQIEFRPSGDPEHPVVLYDNLSYGDYLVGFDSTTPPTHFQVDDNYLYWLTIGGSIRRLSKHGGAPETMVNIAANPRDIVLSYDRVYWLDSLGLRYVNKTCSPLPCTAHTAVGGITGSYLRYVRTPDSLTGYRIYFVDTSQAQQRIRVYSCSSVLCLLLTSDPYVATNDQAWVIGRPAVGPCADGSSSCLYWRQYFGQYNNSGLLRRLPITGGTVEDIATNLKAENTQVETDDQGVYFLNDITQANLARLPFTAAPIKRDLAFDAWEVTQGIQSLANDVPLVAHKTTYVRVFARQLDGTPAGDVEVTLAGTRDGAPLERSPLPSEYSNRALAVGSRYDRGKADQGWLFKLPQSWTEGTITLTASVDPRGIYEESNTANNTHTATFTFVYRAPACMTFLPVRTHTPAV